MHRHLVIVILALAPGTATAASGTDLLIKSYAAQAKEETSTFRNFSVERGRAFYNAEHGTKSGEMSCATCHASDPRTLGKTRANKDIEPLAPSVNRARLSDLATVEKWFRRNCSDVLGRACTALEKGDFITYVRSVQ